MDSVMAACAGPLPHTLLQHGDKRRLSDQATQSQRSGGLPNHPSRRATRTGKLSNQKGSSLETEPPRSNAMASA